MENDKFVFEFVRTFCFLTRHSCHICGGCTEKVEILCEVKSGPEKGLRVCEQCLKSGDVEKRLQKNIKRVEEQLEGLRALSGRLVVPTYAQWESECQAAEQRYLAREKTEEQQRLCDDVVRWKSECQTEQQRLDEQEIL